MNKALQLQKIFHPQTIAAIGASDRDGTVGNALITNLLSGDFSGRIYPVNPKHKIIAKLKSYPSVADLPEQIDLAIIATPARVVPKVVRECGEAGVGGLLIISAGFKEAGEKGKEMNASILKMGKRYGMRILGPNCLGFINPTIGLNASFASGMALPGKMAFISQSGALCSAILDWSIDQSVGFSHFVSVGSMTDIGFHDLIDYFGSDPNTSAILIYMESLRNPRRFMSAARAFARSKPIIVLKAGKSEEGARASLSHTGSLAGSDDVFRTAFRRAGILQVETIQQLFDCAQALAMQPLPKGNHLAVVTNAGGPGILATDYLISRQGVLASLSENTLEQLNRLLPSHWSHGNPVDLLGDAGAEQYAEAVKCCMEDRDVDAILVILTAQSVTDPADVARRLIEIEAPKPMLACWMGEKEVLDGREILEAGKIPNYRYPESAVDVFLKMYGYSNNLKMLYETPPNIPDRFNPEKDKARELIQQVLNTGRKQMTETEAKVLLQHYGIPVPMGKVVQSAEEAARYAKEIGFPVVMKIASSEIGHKTDIGGIILDISDPNEAKTAFEQISEKAKTLAPEAKVDGVRVEKMIYKQYELLIGAKKDPMFGPVIVFGKGGVLVEYYRDTNMGIPPLNMALAKRIIRGTKVNRLLLGFRGMPAADLKLLEFLLVKFAYLVMDFPEIKEIDINPFVIDAEGGLALDAHIVLEKRQLPEDQNPYPHLVICPYPTQYRRQFTMKNGERAILRPIRPEDEPMEAEMFRCLSKQSLYFRFFTTVRRASHEVLVRFTNIDYDREMAIIAEVEEGGEKKMAGVVRIISDAWNEQAEYAIVVADPWQGLGLGRAMTDLILEIAREKGIAKVYGEVLSENKVMQELLQKEGFSKHSVGEGVSYFELDLKKFNP